MPFREKNGASGPKMKQVALLIETSNAYARGLLRGIVSYIRGHQPWSLYLAEHARGDQPPSWLREWSGDGIIARIETEEVARALRQKKMPVVDVSAARLLPATPWVETDDAAIAQMAFEHLHQRGLRNVAFCGDTRFNWSNWRAEHFARAARAEGIPCFVYEPPRRLPPDHTGQVDDIARWLRKLPKPIGIMACYDLRGQQVLDACRRWAIPVPDEVAVVGVDNDELLCELSHPPLSSVIPNALRAGYEASTLLDRMMEEQTVDTYTHLIPPLGVVTRQSTDVLAVDDPQVARAVRFIRDHACEGIAVTDVLRAVPQSRRLFERKFRKVLGHTPHDEILRVQLDRVKMLLAQTDLPLAEIAARTGFAHVEYLSVVFKKRVGVPPSHFRAKCNPSGAEAPRDAQNGKSGRRKRNVDMGKAF